MKLLLILSHSTEAQYREGLFVVHKTRNQFSGLALDQAYEKNNALVKSDGGAAGLTENPGVLRFCIVASPEMSQLSRDFVQKCHNYPEKCHDYPKTVSL